MAQQVGENYRNSLGTEHCNKLHFCVSYLCQHLDWIVAAQLHHIHILYLVS